jgi:succinyl-CoA synthetase beta subunit
MELAGLRYGAQLLKHVDFPVAEVLGPEATEEDIIGLLDRHKQIFIKPVFRGAIGKKGKSGLIGRATDLKTALREKERLYFAEHRHGNRVAKANGVTFEGGVPAEHEIYFSISDSSIYRAPTMTLTHMGGVAMAVKRKDHETVSSPGSSGLRVRRVTKE